MGFKAWIETGGPELELVGMNWNWWAWIKTGGLELKLVGLSWNCTGGLELKLKPIGFKALIENDGVRAIKNSYGPHATYILDHVA